MQADIKVDLSGLKDLARMGAVTAIDFTETREAVKAGAELIQARWAEYVSGVSVEFSGGAFRIHTVSGDYLRAVESGLRYPMDGNVLKGGVVVDLPYADKLEKGFEAYDMKPGLLASGKVKTTVAQDGTVTQYVDIPFHHDSDEIPRAIKVQTNTGGRATGAIRLGGKLGVAQFGIRSQLTPRELSRDAYTWKTGLFAGLYRRESGPEQRGEYMTFRRVSDNSDPSAWIHPGVEPRPVSKALEENLTPELEALVTAAFERDVARLAGGASEEAAG